MCALVCVLYQIASFIYFYFIIQKQMGLYIYKRRTIQSLYQDFCSQQTYILQSTFKEQVHAPLLYIQWYQTSHILITHLRSPCESILSMSCLLLHPCARLLVYNRSEGLNLQYFIKCKSPVRGHSGWSTIDFCSMLKVTP